MSATLASVLDLPDDLLRMIFSYIRSRPLFRVASFVSKRWRKVSLLGRLAKYNNQVTGTDGTRESQKICALLLGGGISPQATLTTYPLMTSMAIHVKCVECCCNYAQEPMRLNILQLTDLGMVSSRGCANCAPQLIIHNLPTLTHLRIAANEKYCDGLIDILRTVHMPALTCLTVELQRAGLHVYTEVTPALHLFIARHVPQLRQLETNCLDLPNVGSQPGAWATLERLACSGTPSALPEIIRKATSLKSLALSTAGLSQELLQLAAPLLTELSVGENLPWLPGMLTTCTKLSVLLNLSDDGALWRPIAHQLTFLYGSEPQPEELSLLPRLEALTFNERESGSERHEQDFPESAGLAGVRYPCARTLSLAIGGLSLSEAIAYLKAALRACPRAHDLYLKMALDSAIVPLLDELLTEASHRLEYIFIEFEELQGSTDVAPWMALAERSAWVTIELQGA